MRYRAVFLDRDGTINKEVHYIRLVKDVKLLPGVAWAIAQLNLAGLLVIVISNQSGLARGYFNEIDFTLIQNRLNELLAIEGAKVDIYYYCPHYYKGSIKRYSFICNCRKPAPGMIYRAVQEMNIDLAGSFLVGDRFRDIICGSIAGLRSVLVKSNIKKELLKNKSIVPDYIAPDIMKAVKWILFEAKYSYKII